MKSLLIALTVAASTTSAFASSPEQVISSVLNVSDQVEAVNLTQGGTLQVVLRERHREIAEQLTQANVQRLTFEASLLANAPLTTEHHAVVCMMYFNPMFGAALSVAPYDEKTGDFLDGAPKTVLTPSSCALSSATFPTDRAAFAMASSLKDSLIALGSEALAHSLQN